MSGSILPLKTYVNADTTLFGTGTGGGTVSTFPDLTCSTILVQDCFIGFGDGTHLSTIAGQLYYDNELVASQSSISSVGDWSLFPAISTVDMAGQSLSSIGVGEMSSLLIHDANISSFLGGYAIANEAGLQFGVAASPNLGFLATSEAESTWRLTGASTFGKIGLSSTLQGVYVLDQGNNAFTFSGGQFSAPAGAFSTLYTNNLSTQTFTAVSTTVFQETISSLSVVADTANFSTLWGQPSSFYQNPVSTLSTLFVSDYISTPSLYVSSINGAEFTSTQITVQVAGVSSLVANTISSIGAELRTALVSTLQFNPSFSPNLDVNLGLGSLFGNLAGAATGALGVVVGGAALGTGIAALAQARQTKTIGNSTFELVNGTTQLQVSTVGQTVSSIFRFVSSVDANTPGQEFFASTIIPAGTPCIRSISDPLNTVSSPNSTIQYFGQWVGLDQVVPIPSTISSFNQLFTSSIGASTVNFPNGTQFRVGSSFGAGAGVSTLELFWSAASPPLDAYLRLGGLLFSGDDVGGLNYTKDVLVQNANSGNRLLVYGVGSGPSTIAYLSDIPGAQPVVSSFQTASVSSLSVSSVNGGIPYTTANPQPAPAVVSSFQTASISSLSVSSVNGGIPYTTANPPPGTFTNVNVSSLRVSSIGDIGTSSIYITNADLSYLDFNNAGDITGIATNYINFQAQGTGGQLAGYIANAGGLGSWSNYATGPMFLNASSIRMSTNAVQFNTLSTNNATLTNLSLLGLSTITLSTSTAAGAQSQPAGRLVMGGNDLDLGQQDIWCQQIRLGAGNPTNAQTEIIFYDAAANQRGLQTALQDRTIRVVSTINANQGGYLLDTGINPPFFSTINAGTSTALFAFFPSSINSTIGASTLSVIPNPIFLATANSLSSQQVLAANTPLALDLGSLGTNVGGYTLAASTLTVPVAGTYQFSPSLQFNTTTGGSQVVDFWMTKNGADLPNSASRISVANNAQQIGTVVICDTAAANDKYGIKIASADANMQAAFFQSTVGAPYTRPAIPSVILNAQRVA